MTQQSSSREDEKTGGIQVIARAAKILNALGEHPGGMSLGEIAHAVDLPRSTVQRIVARWTAPNWFEAVGRADCVSGQLY